MIFSKQIKELKDKAWPFWLTMLANLGINTTKNALAKRLPDDSPEEILTVNLATVMLAIVRISCRTKSPTTPNKYVKGF